MLFSWVLPARALTVEDLRSGLVLGTQTYASVIVTSSSNTALRVTATPVSFDNGQWSYQFDWQRYNGRQGSIYVMEKNNLFSKPLAVATADSQSGKAATLKPNTSYRVEYYSSPNGKGTLLLRKYFVTLQAENGGGSSDSQTYASVIVTSSSNTALRVTATPVSFDNGQWSYQFDWQRYNGRQGSIYVMEKNNLFSKPLAVATADSQSGKAATLKPNTSYRVEYYSSPNGKGTLLLRKYFVTLQAENGGGFICDYAAPPQGCSYKQGPNYNPSTNCGMVLDCSGASSCQTLWWYDSSHSSCSQKQFCGTYMYQGLKTFSTQAACQADLAANNTPASVKATLSSPAAGSTLTGPSAVFAWSAGTGVAKYRLEIGSGQGQTDIFTGELTGISKTVTSLPTDGRILHIRLWSYINNSWGSNYNDYTIKAYSVPAVQLPANATFRYLRVDSLQEGWVSWREAEFYDAQGNKIPSNTITASSETAYPGHPASNVLDGNIFTDWNAGETCSNSVQRPDGFIYCKGIQGSNFRAASIKFDLGSVKTVSKIRLMKNGSSDNERDMLLVSSDGNSYLTAGMFSGFHGKGNYISDQQWLEYEFKLPQGDPAASITVNGLKEATVKWCDKVDVKWSSANADIFTSSVKLENENGGTVNQEYPYSAIVRGTYFLVGTLNDVFIPYGASLNGERVTPGWEESVENWPFGLGFSSKEDTFPLCQTYKASLKYTITFKVTQPATGKIVQDTAIIHFRPR
ncbi:MAG: hypothetical protein M1383_05230 [Patescibacteria group bacterium]|nr:hypothetical protein [Patescibacteria group bacterium]